MLKIYLTLPLVFFCWLFLVNISSAQSSGDIWLSTGIQNLSSRDEGFSLMKYKGNKTTSTVGFNLSKRNKTQWFQGDFSYGVLTNQVGGGLNEMGVNFITHTFYHKVKSPDRGLHWGWANKNTFHIRSHNNFSNYNFRYDYFSALGPSVRYILPFVWKKKSFVWQNGTNWQLIGLQVKSGYIGAEPEDYLKGESLANNFFNTVRPFIPVKDLDLGFSSSLFWKLPTNNQLGIRYQYNYSKLSGIKVVHRLDQSLELVLNVRLW